MIIFFGPAGAGKSVQGQMLAARMGWRWLSAGQLLRDTKDMEVLSAQQQGGLVDSNKVNQVVGDALNRSTDIARVILDGFPRQVDQARWLVDNQPMHGRSIGLVIILDVPAGVIFDRLKLRGRVDDTPEVIQDRLNIYGQEIDPILNYFAEQGIETVHIDGAGTVGQVHDSVVDELIKRNLV